MSLPKPSNRILAGGATAAGGDARAGAFTTASVDGQGCAGDRRC
jgi:hypothetical protein